MHKKRRLASHEEFEIMKLVLDKFLWIGTFLLVLGLYKSLTSDVQDGLLFTTLGVVVMLTFGWFIVREFELLR